jgi:hypothetical protein
MVARINHLVKQRDACRSTVLPAHYRPKEALNDTPRGHSSGHSRVNGTDMRLATITKQKDADAGLAVIFSLGSVNLGSNEDGEPPRPAW